MVVVDKITEHLKDLGLSVSGGHQSYWMILIPGSEVWATTTAGLEKAEAVKITVCTSGVLRISLYIFDNIKAVKCKWQRISN